MSALSSALHAKHGRRELERLTAIVEAANFLRVPHISIHFHRPQSVDHTAAARSGGVERLGTSRSAAGSFPEARP